MILSAQSIAMRCLPLDAPARLITPFHMRSEIDGFTYGLGPAGYDVRLAEDVHLDSTGYVVLGSTIEHFHMPDDLIARVCDKSSWARRGLFVQNTVIEPGWRGYLTLELTYARPGAIDIKAGCPIAQILFEELDKPTALPYEGKYQDQEAGPQVAR